jgi:tricorn protease-like protein
MTWCESSFNERWFNKDYSIVKAYDFSTGKTRKVTSKTRYFSPSPSPDGSRLAVVSNDLMGRSSIVIIDSKKGQVQKTLPNTGNVSYAQLRWADNNHVVGMALAPRGNTITLIDVETGTEKLLLDYTSVDISRPFASGDYIYFSAGFTGIDNIYALHIPTKKVWQVTNVRFGAFEPCASVDGKKLLYAEYTADGYRIKEIPLEPSSWKAYSTGFTSDIRFHEPLFKAEGKNLSLVSFDSTYQATKYNALTDGLFNFYGWFPIPNIPEYGAEFYTQNIMSTLRGTIGILYNTNENNLHSYLRLTYAALYPVIDLQYEYGLNRKGKVFDNATLLNKEIEWTENIASGGITLPFRLTQGTHVTRLSISGWYAYYDVNAMDTTNLEQPESHYFFSSIKPTLQFSRFANTGPAGSEAPVGPGDFSIISTST